MSLIDVGKLASPSRNTEVRQRYNFRKQLQLLRWWEKREETEVFEPKGSEEGSQISEDSNVVGSGSIQRSWRLGLTDTTGVQDHSWGWRERYSQQIREKQFLSPFQCPSTHCLFLVELTTKEKCSSQSLNPGIKNQSLKGWECIWEPEAQEPGRHDCFPIIPHPWAGSRWSPSSLMDGNHTCNSWVISATLLFA